MDDEDILARVGTFLIVMASGFIVLFVASDMAETVYFDLFFIGILLGGTGLYMRRKAPSPPPSGRFDSWKKWRAGKLKEEQDAKRAQRKQESSAKQQARKEARQAKKTAKKGGDD